MVELDFMKSEYIPFLKNYHLDTEQREFTAMPMGALEKCEKDVERHPIVILYKGEPAGFFVLHEGDGPKTYTDDPHALLLRAYSISTSFQGKGIAKESMKRLPGFVQKHFPDKKEVVLGVNHGNQPAKTLYLKAGFEDRGGRFHGRKGEQFILHMPIYSVNE
ncbi:GNAT family N-acetyltransferase [Falsibacillus pallidus]|uniref:Acetyltransferase (GNAT) family protein n=1 Tax=Falsibacillus pallidus TaxID=493781 RepID=A0A370GQJ1_9BACI|nr:GNAT family N-acetyltransferase [Falsibacillus pallidus]RDI45590.1 acetyltransferase (GNAT) family protein [Falsibacillus pallidus]